MLSYQDWRRSCLPPPLWIPAFAGMTNSVAGTIHPGSECPGHAGRLAAVLPPPAPLDSGFRRNDEFGGGNHSSGIGVRDTLSYEDWRRSCLPPPLWIPAFAGMTNSVAGTIHPGSESDRTRFRTKTGGGLASPRPSGFRPSPE